MAIIGIDLGTTNSLAAVWKDGASVLIPNRLGDVLTPSVVSVDDDGTLLVGKTARERLVTHPQATAALFKRTMGTSKIYALGDKAYTSEDLSALVLRSLREDAEAFLGEPVTEAVVSVPAYFNDKQRSATKRAGKLAGLHVERLVNEPSAAALAGQRGQEKQSRVFLVFDFGGGTLDVSIVDCFEDIISVVAVHGDNRLGGTDFDLAIAKLYCAQNKLNYDSLTQQQQGSLLRLAEDCKQALSAKQDSPVFMVSTLEGIAGQMALTNETLVQGAQTLFGRMVAPVRRAVADSGLSAREIDALVLVGGSCHMPVVGQYLEYVLHMTPVHYGSPDTLVALGTGIYAGIKARAGEVKDIVLTDLCPFTLGTSVVNPLRADLHLSDPIIERNSALPTSRMKRYFTAVDFQTFVSIDVCQGENMYTQDNIMLGEVKIAVPKALRGQIPVDVRFTYDINGILEVEVTETSTGKMEHLLLIGDGTDITPEQAQARMQELAALKVSPAEEEQTKLLTAHAQRLFAECTGYTRSLVEREYNIFAQGIATQEEASIRRARARMAAFLKSLERHLRSRETGAFGFDFEEDESAQSGYEEDE